METLSLYVHWPFCQSKCPYCDFNSHVRESIDSQAWVNAYIAEIKRHGTLIGPRQLNSIFFGGGTPSLMDPKIVEQIIQTACHIWTPAQDIEITLEANPTSVEQEKFKNFRSAGINRVSIGIQSFDEHGLKSLGRTHDKKEAITAIEVASRIFPRFSFDLIYGRYGQSLDDWAKELNFALNFSSKHLSLYQLTIELGTPFERREKLGEKLVWDPDTQADFYELTNDIMSKAGMPPYEISNYASPNEQSRHNLTYWNYTDYAGVGPGAHGRLSLPDQTNNKIIKKLGTYQRRTPEAWLKQVNESGHGNQDIVEITPLEQTTEAIMMGLRLSEGINIKNLALPLSQVINQKNFDLLVAKQELIFEDDTLKLSPMGRQRLNSILSFILN